VESRGERATTRDWRARNDGCCQRQSVRIYKIVQAICVGNVQQNTERGNGAGKQKEDGVTVVELLQRCTVQIKEYVQLDQDHQSGRSDETRSHQSVRRLRG